MYIDCRVANQHMQVEVLQWIIFNCRLFFLSIVTQWNVYISLYAPLTSVDFVLFGEHARPAAPGDLLGPRTLEKKCLGREVRSIWKHSEISFSSLHHL